MRFVDLAEREMTALLSGELPMPGLSDYFLDDRAQWLWRYRLGQMAADPANTAWMVRLAAYDSDGMAVGHCGFHGPPDEHGMVEIGYSVAPEFRRRGYGRAMLVELLRRAAADPGVAVVRATIAPDNVASLATIAGFGFVETGEQWDEEDGREIIFEVAPAR
ncbi:GNAT family N-acetyltransferase [Nonomuraea sp. NPDC050556]|uniref:GNAT family N-acetyltransferase n=1 Tax=Nonomuraea sp. NPDC050556 TaxID=3364369 RepID=UPI0037885A03